MSLAKPLFIAFIACLANVATQQPSSAGGIAKYIQPQPDSPVSISACTGDVSFSENRWGTFTSTLSTGVDFTNISPKTVVAVLFRMQLANAFGDVLGNQMGQATGQFSSNVPIVGNKWASTDKWAGLGAIRCSVSRVLFADGSVWSESPTSASPAPTSPS